MLYVMLRLKPQRRVTAIFLCFPFLRPVVLLHLVYRTYAVDDLTVFLRRLGLLKELSNAILDCRAV